MLARAPLLRRLSRAAKIHSQSGEKHLKLLPDYFSVSEQRVLLEASLSVLDAKESRRSRKKRQLFLNSLYPKESKDNIESLFLPDEYYEFEEGHFDGVIHNYRETHLSQWPVDKFPELSPILGRLYCDSLLPSKNVITHLLHLATDGEILPHTDNVGASGSWILGVSLGSKRQLRMSRGDHTFEAELPSGSVYLQRDALRYEYQHSISKPTAASPIGSAQRLSIMIRDRHPDDT